MGLQVLITGISGHNCIQSSTTIKRCGILQPYPNISHFITLRETRETTTHHWRLVVFLRICIFEDLFLLTLARLNGDQLAVDVNGLWLVDAYCLDLLGWFTLWHTYVHYVTYPFSESQFAQSGTICSRKELGNNAFVEKFLMEPREEAVSFRSDQGFLKDHHSTREKHMCSTCWTCKHQLQTEQIIWLENWN